MSVSSEDEEEERRRQEALKKAEEEEEGGLDRAPDFVNDLAREVTGGASVADRINQQKHYTQRGKSAGAEGFMRR